MWKHVGSKHPEHDDEEEDGKLGKDGRMVNPMFADNTEDGDKKGEFLKKITRKQMDLALEAVESGEMGSSQMFAMMDSYYKSEVEKVRYEGKPRHSELLHEAPTNWYATVSPPFFT